MSVTKTYLVYQAAVGGFIKYGKLAVSRNGVTLSKSAKHSFSREDRIIVDILSNCPLNYAEVIKHLDAAQETNMSLSDITRYAKKAFFVLPDIYQKVQGGQYRFLTTVAKKCPIAQSIKTPQYNLLAKFANNGDVKCGYEIKPNQDSIQLFGELSACRVEFGCVNAAVSDLILETTAREPKATNNVKFEVREVFSDERKDYSRVFFCIKELPSKTNYVEVFFLSFLNKSRSEAKVAALRIRDSGGSVKEEAKGIRENIRKRMNVSMIVSVNKHNQFGTVECADLPWHIPADLKFFKDVTMGSICIVGRKTYDSLPNRMPGRRFIVVSAKQTREALPSKGDGLLAVCDSPERAYRAALEHATLNGVRDVFFIGGKRVYEDSLSFVNRVIKVTHNQSIPEGQTPLFFPELDSNVFILEHEACLAEDVDVVIYKNVVQL